QRAALTLGSVQRNAGEPRRPGPLATGAVKEPAHRPPGKIALQKLPAGLQHAKTRVLRVLAKATQQCRLADACCPQDHDRSPGLLEGLAQRMAHRLELRPSVKQVTCRLLDLTGTSPCGALGHSSRGSRRAP